MNNDEAAFSGAARSACLDISRKTRFTRLDSVLEIHRSLHSKLELLVSQPDN